MMFKFLFNSFQVNGASQTTLISFLFNNAVNAVGGYLIFSETLSLRWCVSMLLILAGIMLLSKDGTQSANK
jgi:drug/metabolite transporter (DMT)-like permease